MKKLPKLMLCLWLCLSFILQVSGSPGLSHKPLSKTLPKAALKAPPAVGFTYVTNGGCAPVTVQFYSQLNGPSYFWTFGDGGTSTDCNPLHTYTLPGVYTVTLTATGGTYTTTITVGAVPVVTFAGDTVSCQYDVKSYTITSTIPPASYSWTAQGGTVTSSTATTATVSWSSYGVNYLYYNITTAAGCTKVFRYKVKVIAPPTVNMPCCTKRQENPDGTQPRPPGQGEQEPVNGGDGPCNVCANSYACYTATIDPEFGTAGDYYWNWAVTNGTIVSICSDSTTACVVWGSSGSGTIKLTMINKKYGCKMVKECNLIITPGITPVFTVSGNCISTPVYFDASATTPLSDITSYFWEFGDGYTATTNDPFTSHPYNFVGTYTATLTITTKEGCTYKVSHTFNVISGTKPEIACPGTVCEGSRQCYSTAYISGATYTWNIAGDIPALRTYSANGDQVCVTWGSGPVGTVKVTVAGGGYTCTNFAEVSIAIVSNSIPIDAPDYICNSTFFVQASTANYTGACYIWKINGVVQTGFTTNEINFNPMLYSSPITLDVQVDFKLGCCKGTGTKVITKLPQYSMNSYTNDVCIGSTVTYTLYFPAGTASPPVSWSVDGGTIVSYTSTSVTIKWTTPGQGSMTANNNSPTQYCNDASNSTWHVTVWDKATGEDISGPKVVCSGNSYTYYHGFEYPTASATITTVPPISITTGTYSSVLNFPSVASVTTYTVFVTYNHAVVGGCGTTKTYTVTSVPNTIPTFTIPPPVVCQGDVVTYTCAMSDTSFFKWDVVGGVITYQNYSGGILTISVQWNSTVTSSITVTNKICGNSNTQNITVNGRPVVIISQSAVSCGSTSVTLSVAPIWTSFSWSTGSTTNSTSVTAPGIYSVTVSNGVCTNTGSANVTVVTPTPPVINSFTVTRPSVNWCPKYDQICPNITLGSGSITSYSWTFTGFTPSTSNLQCPFVALTSNPGTGTWSLTVTDQYGCTATNTGTLTDTCTPPNDTTYNPCVTTYAATFSISYDPCTEQFTSSGTNYSAVFWDFGDGTMGSGFNPFHNYAGPCNYTVNCLVTDINGCTKLFTFTINVPYTFHNAHINVINSTCLGATSLRFVGLSICPGSGLSATYAWTITPLAGGPPVYSVTTTSPVLNVGSIPAIPNGDFVATVTVTIAGCSHTYTVNFNKGGLRAYFVSCGGCAGSPLSFIDQSTPYSAPIIQWFWKFTGPSGTITSFLQNPTVLFSTPGLHTVSLTVTDNNLCTNTYTITVNIFPPFVPGNMIVNGSSTPNGTTFNICPNDPYVLVAPPGVSYLWSDGTTGPSTTVTGPGDYSVTVFNANNCSAKVGPIHFLYKPAPEADIISYADQCAPRLLRAFTGVGYSYQWTYPVSMTSSAKYIYLATGGLVTLKVTNVHGCSATTSGTFVVYPTPFVSMSYAPTPFCPGSTITITGAPSGGTPAYNHLWSNGNMTPSITVSDPGVYQDFVTDANGCKATGTISIQPALPDGMDKLPYGCYDVCGPVTFCTGTMPFGWTGQWYLGASPYGSVIPQGGNIAITFGSAGTYTLHYTPVNPAISCPAISRPITLNFITLPTPTITSSSNPPVICTGSGGSLVLTVNPQDPQYTYTWYLGTTAVGTGYTLTVTTPGTYTVTISKNPCCSKSASIDVAEANCCFDHPDVKFQQILADTTLTVSTFWHDKYYIDATVTVAGSSILDITNVDIVFGRNGKIIFKDQSFIRCNNSVLRPCTKDDIWQGLSFLDRSSGWINTTTIKNAVTAVGITNNTSGVRLTDNSFIKCNISVNIQQSQSQQSISGNSFEIDESSLPYSSTNYWGIRLLGSQMKGVIAQNTFRHVQPQNTSNTYFGIYATGSNMTASENDFNDMFRAIDVSVNTDIVAIEKNTIKLNTLKQTYDRYQIRATNCDNPVLIYENTLENGIVDNSTAGGIYVEHTTRTHVKDNKVNAFLVAITGVNTKELHVNTNTITNSTAIGVGLYSTDNTIVSCNTINSMATNQTQAAGSTKVGILDWNGNGTSQIYSNCVFNMNTAIDLRTFAGANFNLPGVVNNYLYNYLDNGVFNLNYSGNIGNPGGAVNAGRNTFMSNNGAIFTTLDINSAPVIAEAGNFGVLLTSGVVSLTPTDLFYSTAACGQQIQQTYPNNQLDKYNICDIYYLDEWAIRNGEGYYVLKPAPYDMTAANIDDYLKDNKTEVYGLVTAQMLKDKANAENAANAVLKSSMERNTAARLLTAGFLGVSAPDLAAQFLARPELSSINADLKVSLGSMIEVAKGNMLDGGQKQTLVDIDNRDVENSPIAREVLQAQDKEYDYKFFRFPTPQYPKTTQVLSRNGNNLKVFPVPASTMVNLFYNVSDAKVKAIKVVSTTGAEVVNYSYTVQAGMVKMDIANLAPGAYSVVVVTDGKVSSTLTGRFIKL